MRLRCLTLEFEIVVRKETKVMNNKRKKTLMFEEETQKIVIIPK